MTNYQGVYMKRQHYVRSVRTLNMKKTVRDDIEGTLIEVDESMEQANRDEIITNTVNSIKETLLEKNRRYGNSTATPIKVFSLLDSKEGIFQRLDDKLKRIKTSRETGFPLRKNDVFDTIGYLCLLCVEEGWEDFSDLLD